MTREIIDNILKHNNIFTNSHCYDLKEFHVKEKKIKQDLLVAYIAMNASQGEKLPQVEGASDFRGISITLNLGGIFCFENNHVFERSLPNSTNILYSPKMQGNTKFESRSHTSISLMIKDQFLGQDFLEQLRIDTEKDNVLKNSPTHPMTWICFRDLIDSPYEGVLGDMFTESKILEIVTNEFSSMLSSHNMSWSSDGISLTFQDIKALKKARQILLEKIDNPPSIRELARMVATNEYKLKAGFKQLFGITPYALLRNHIFRIQCGRNIKNGGNQKSGPFHKGFFLLV